ncbi:MAG: M56 family metallopeptidase [Acidimicrobiia bacterium]
MRLDTANRAFAAFLGVCAATLALVGMAACTLLGIVAYRVRHDGFDALSGSTADVTAALVFLTLVAVGSLLGLLSLWHQWSATTGLVRHLRAHRLPLPASLTAAAERAALTGRVDLVDSGEQFSFAYGITSRRVAVSRGLVESVSPTELDAVLEHERYHVTNLDPIKIVFARTLAPALFFLPALRDLRTRYTAARELAADRRAVERYGRVPLASALYKVVSGPQWAALGPAAAIGGAEFLDDRVTQLETGKEPPARRLSVWTGALSVLGASVLVWSFAASVIPFGGPGELARRLCGQG